MSIRTLIVDDEFLARERLKKLLQPYEDFKIVGESKNGEEALKEIDLKSPHLVFLDVQMPCKNGIEVVQSLQKAKKPIPIIVFTTAHDEYALKAFETNAIDYLLKPFDKNRFFQSIERIREQYQLKQSLNLNQKMMNLMKSFNSSSSDYRTLFTLKEKGKEVQIHTDDIVYFKADGNYIQLVTLDKKWLYRATMSQLEKEIEPNSFLRIHRSILLNIHYIKSYQYLNNNEYKFQLKNGDEVISARSHKLTISDYLSNNG